MDFETAKKALECLIKQIKPEDLPAFIKWLQEQPPIAPVEK